jgi:hypothetical protein
MVSKLLMHSLPIAVVLAYFCGFIYLWYRNAKGD